MIISQAPCRITLGGGGTDLPSYYEKQGGFTITGAINKYVFVSAYKQFYDDIRLKYSEIEIVKNIDHIRHQLFREALRYTKIDNQIELTSLADVPAGTGLGSSGAFLVALLNTLAVYNGSKQVTKRNLARTACNIELDILKLHEGKQDKYAAAFGGIKMYTYTKDGRVSIESFPDEDYLQRELSDKLYMFYTGQERCGVASDALEYQDDRCLGGNIEMIDYLHEICNIGYKTKICFCRNDFDEFGRLLNEHWEIKKQYSPFTTDKYINKCYRIGLENGALGGKLMGAGGGGFLLFYHPGTTKEIWKFIVEMKKLGLQETKFEFDNQGVQTILGG